MIPPATPMITAESVEGRLDWLDLCDALADGHMLPPARAEDTILMHNHNTMLTRSAWIDGLGMLVKTATVFPDNAQHAKSSINGAVALFADRDGRVEAFLDFHLLTWWKTATDSLWAASRLARPESRQILIVGAGTVGASLVAAYPAHFPQANIRIWNRSPARAIALASRTEAEAVINLEAAVNDADIIACTTMSREPVIRGEWLRPGQHLDLIGAYRADMREVDDTALRRGRLFCDYFDSVVDRIGEFAVPLATGAIKRADILADFYSGNEFQRRTREEITICKNGGGAHLDLMTARYILQCWNS